MKLTLEDIENKLVEMLCQRNGWNFPSGNASCEDYDMAVGEVKWFIRSYAQLAKSQANPLIIKGTEHPEERLPLYKAKSQVCPDLEREVIAKMSLITVLTTSGASREYVAKQVISLCKGTGKVKKPDREKIAKLGFQYSELIDDKDIEERWYNLHNQEKWFYMANQIIALLKGASPLFDEEEK